MADDQRQEAEDAILQRLYVAFSNGVRRVGTDELRGVTETSSPGFDNAMGALDVAYLVRAVTNDSCAITPAGVTFVEDNKLVDEKLVGKNLALRATILELLAVAPKVAGRGGGVDIQTIIESTGKDALTVVNNVEVMQDYGLIDVVSSTILLLTDTGLRHAEQAREYKALIRDFEDLSRMEAHRRGRELNPFFAKVAGAQGWNEAVSVKTSNEELDVVLHREREFFLVECKWEKGPIQAKEVSAFYAKLTTRAGVKGIVVSMSGFTEGSGGVVLSSLHDRAILLFGREDMNSLVYKSASLEDLIDEKYAALISKKIVLVDAASQD